MHDERIKRIVNVCFLGISVFLIVFELVIFQFDFAAVLIAIILGVPLIVDIFNPEEKEAILLPKKIFSFPKQIACFLAALGFFEIIVQFTTGGCHRIHHIALHIFVLPLITLFALDYLNVLDKKYHFVERTYERFIHEIRRFSIIGLQLGIYFMYASNREYGALDYTNLANAILSIIQTMYIYLILVVFVCIITFIITEKQIEYEIAFPRKLLFSFPLFLFSWGIMVFYLHPNRMETNFYIGVFAYLVVSLTISFSIVYKCYKDSAVTTRKKMRKDSILLALINVATICYGIFVYFMEVVWKFAPIQKPDSPTRVGPIVFIWIFVILTLLITIAFIALVNSTLKEGLRTESQQDKTVVGSTNQLSDKNI